VETTISLGEERKQTRHGEMGGKERAGDRLREEERMQQNTW